MSEERSISTLDLRNMLSQACDMAGGQAAWSRKHSIHRTIVTDTIAGRRDPSPAVLNAMGLMRVERFIPIKRGSNG